MQRTLNLRLLLWTAASLGVFGLSVHLVHAVQTRRNASALLRQADRLVHEGNLDKASFYFSRYLVFEPDDVQALERYALAVDKLASHSSEQMHAALVLDQAFRRSPKNTEIGLRLVHQQVALERYSEAISNLEKLRALGLKKGQAEHLLGWAYEARGAYAARGEAARADFNAAAAWLNKAVEAVPEQIESYLFLVHVYANRLSNNEEAAAVLDRLIERNRQSAQAYLVRARFHRESGRPDPADKDLNEALRLAPKEPEVLLQAARWDLEKEDFDGARKHLEQGLALCPQAPPLYATLAKLEIKMGDRKEAIQVLRGGLAKSPGAPELLALLADTLLDEGKEKEAGALLAELGKARPEAPEADFLKARVLALRKKWSETADLCQRALPKLDAADEWLTKALLLLGKCYEKLGCPDQQLAAFSRLLARDADSRTARVGLASAYLALGRVEESLTELEALTKLRDAPAESWTLLTRVLLLRTVQFPPGQRDWQKVSAALDRAKELSPDDTVLLHAELLAAQQKMQEADGLLEQEIAKAPKRVELWCSRSDLAIRQGKSELAKKILDEAERVAGDSPELRLALARWALRERPDRARRLLAPLTTNLETFAEDEQVRLLQHFAAVWKQLGDSAMARKLWKELADRQPRDLDVRSQLFELACQSNDLTEARRLLGQIKQIEGASGSFWRYADAVLAFTDARNGDKRALTRARERLDEVRVRQKTWPRVPLLEARIAEWEGDLWAALDRRRHAFELGEREPRTVHHFARLLLDAGQYTEAETVLRAVDEQVGLNAGLIRLGVEAASLNQNSARALQLASRVVDPSSGDYRDLLWFGDLLMAAGEKQHAEVVLRRAWEVGSHTPETWVALVDCLARAEKWTEAEAVVQQAEAQLPQDRRTLAVARCFEALSRYDRAESLYEQALRQAPDDFTLLNEIADFFLRADQPAKAESYLRKLESTPEVRRRLAFALAERGDLAGANAALEGDTSTAGQRVRAFILSLTPGQAKHALKAFDQTLSRQPLTADEQLVHARICAGADDPLRSREILVSLANRFPDSGKVLAACVRDFIRSSDMEDARAYFARLQKREPHSARTRALAAAVRQAS